MNAHSDLSVLSIVITQKEHTAAENAAAFRDHLGHHGVRGGSFIMTLIVIIISSEEREPTAHRATMISLPNDSDLL